MEEQISARSPRLVLNAGAGRPGPHQLHGCFRGETWREIRIDIDPAVSPDVIGSVLDMRAHFSDATFDAIWSSHNIEHLYGHEVPIAMAEFRRVLKPDGFAVVTCPDIQSVAEAMLEHGIDWTAYDAPIGPVTVHDMMFGHGGSVAAGNTFMAHRTAFTQHRLGTLALSAGFREVRVGRGQAFDLWAILPMENCSLNELYDLVKDTNLLFLYTESGEYERGVAGA